MRPIFPNRILLVVVCGLITAFSAAQVLNKPEAAPNSNIGATDPWTAACASAVFNEYFVNFTWSPTPSLVNGDNEFILELSDSNGDFSNPIELDRVGDKNTEFDFDFVFSVPTDVRGENFRLRVRSTSPERTSPSSDAYSMYYIDYNGNMLISKNGDGMVPGTISLCDGNSVTLEPHNVPNADTYQYNWYRSGTLLSEKSKSLTTSTAGMYTVEIDYGSVCSGSANTISNIVEIITGSSQGVAINPPSKTTLCSGETVTLQANVTGQGLDYTWYKDGAVVAGPTLEGDSYVVDANITGFEGDYEVEVSGSGICQERSAAITITSAGGFEVTLDNPSTIVILPSQTITLSVSTTAGTPAYQWYKDGSAISGAISSALDVTEVGVYFARVTESGACSSTKDSESTAIVAPNSFELIVDYTTSYTSCVSTDVTLSVSQINAVASDGRKTDVTASMQNTFSYQWNRNGAALSGETSSAIIVADNANNGSYSLDGTTSGFNASSNTLEVQLRTSETVAISSSETVVCEGSDNVTLSTSRDLSGATFEWQRAGQNINSTDAELTVTQSGSYELVVTIDGCPVASNTIIITDFDDAQLVLDSEANIVFPEGESQTVTASGASNYEWYDANNALLSNTNSFTFTEEGNYLLLATIGNCQVSRALTVEYRDNFQVPNVITANGDGINDLWVLPNTYSRKSDISVLVFNEKGQEIFNEANYQNNWPQSTASFNQQNMVFYYKIRKENRTIKQGTITVIR